MAWKIEFHPDAAKDLRKLDRTVQKRILSFLKGRVLKAADPRTLGRRLSGEWGELWRYRVGDYRVVCRVEDFRLLVLVVRIGHRRAVYDR